MSHAIQVGQIDVAMAGGVESMTKNYQTRGVPIDVSPSLRTTGVKPAADCLMSMGNTSENVAARYKVSREVQDSFALRSHERAIEAQLKGASSTRLSRLSTQYLRGAQSPSFRW